jgi:RHS repeat-associated protein
MGNLRSERARASQWIGELGIYDYRHRMYNPDLSRFLQTDPTGFDAGDMNLFRYCDDDPLDGSDPTGLFDMWGNLHSFFSGNPSMSVVRDAWNERRSAGNISFGLTSANQRKTNENEVYKSFNDAAAAQKEAAYNLMGRDHEAGTEIWQRDDGSASYRSDLPRPGDGLYKIKDGPEKGKRMLGFEVDPNRHPRGYHIAGWMYAHPFYRPEVPPNDQRRAFNRGWNVYLVTPARADRQQFGLRNVVTYRYPDRPTD